MKHDDRFQIIHKEGNTITSGRKTILVDKETGVQYLFVMDGYAGGLTPLLGADGKPLLYK